MIQRDSAIDALKAIGLILVITGHTDVAFIGGGLATYIYSFHMPLFFWITGYLSSGKEEKQFLAYVLKKTKKLLLPYLIFYIISLVYGFIILPKLTNTYVIPFDFHQVVRSFLLSSEELNKVPSYNFALWYLPLSFICVCVFYWIKKIKNHLAILVLILVIAALTVPIQQLIPGRPPLHINVLPAAIVFMGLGYLYPVIEKLIFPWPLSPLLAILSIYLVYINGVGNIANILSPLYFITATISIYLYFHLSQSIKSSKLLVFIGRNGLIVYGLHSLALNAYFHTPIPNEFSRTWNGSILLVTTLLFTLSLLVFISGGYELLVTGRIRQILQQYTQNLRDFRGKFISTTSSTRRMSHNSTPPC